MTSLFKKLSYFLKFFFVSSILMNFGTSIAKEKIKTTEFNYSQICKSIAEDIQKVKKRYPQLQDFSVSNNLDIPSCAISYKYKVHQPPHVSGWRGSFPESDPDGVIFYIYLWDESLSESQLAKQIDTQARMAPLYLGKRHVTYLILEGEKTKKINIIIRNILIKHGMILKPD